MHEDGWNRFMQTGQIHDYLAYKGNPDMKEAKSKAGEIQDYGHTGFCDIDRDDSQGRTIERIR